MLGNDFSQLNFDGNSNKDIYDLIKIGDVDKIKSKLENHLEESEAAEKEYNVWKHGILTDPNRQGKEVQNADGKRIDFIRQWNLPINYPQYINEIALVFLYGRPVKWGCKSEGTDRGFVAYTDFIEHTHFNSKVRQMKRVAGAYTQSALLFRTYQNSDGKADCQIRVLSHKKGDKIYSRWDQYENLLSVAWGYSTKDADNKVTEHFDIFLPEYIFRCQQGQNGWEVTQEENKIGKIPVIICPQEKEWAGVEAQIEREEYIHSRTADTNDYFADPHLILNSDIILNMPKKEDSNKTWVVNGETDSSKAAAYLTWDSAPEAKKLEIEQLQNHILSKTFTPNIDFENMKSLSNVTGKALKQMMILANIKAQKHREQHDELMERAASLIKAIIGNVLDVSLKAECDKMQITHEFQDPFGEDVSETIDNLVKAVDGGIQSRESAVEQSPLTKDPNTELERLKAEQEEASAAQRDMFTQQSLVEDGSAE